MSGKKLSEEHKKKLSNSLKGIKRGPMSYEHKMKLRESHIGKKRSDETKKKISDSIKDKNHPMYGRKHSEDSRRKMSISHTGISPSIETRNKISKSLLGYQRGEFTDTHRKKLSEARKDLIISNDTRTKLRLNRIKQIQHDRYNGNQVFPSYNPTACKIIDEYGKKHGYNFQHAMNGGEFYIKELGYWVDGYDKDKNVVVEYQETWHKYKIEKDAQRKKEIINFLQCKFIEIKE